MGLLNAETETALDAEVALSFFLFVAAAKHASSLVKFFSSCIYSSRARKTRGLLDF